MEILSVNETLGENMSMKTNATAAKEYITTSEGTPRKQSRG